MSETGLLPLSTLAIPVLSIFKPINCNLSNQFHLRYFRFFPSFAYLYTDNVLLEHNGILI